MRQWRIVIEEHNFHISVRYGLTPTLYDFEWTATMTSTDFDDELAFVESFRGFYKHVKKELDAINSPHN